MEADGLIYVGERIQAWLTENLNQKLFILLPYSHQFTYLYISHLHKKDHSGVETTLAKLQSKYWVPKARRIIYQVKHKCVICRKADHITLQQKMGQLPNRRLHASPPFFHTAVDIFGPFNIRDTVKKRTKGKAYGIVFNCLSSRAVYIDLADGYDTDSFLLVFRRFTSVRGYPTTMQSDGGTQLLSANKELTQVVSKWDHAKLAELGSNQGMSWIVNKSADAPWENGCSESLIKLIKDFLG